MSQYSTVKQYRTVKQYSYSPLKAVQDTDRLFTSFKAPNNRLAALH
jgi:hypothetical protein